VDVLVNVVLNVLFLVGLMAAGLVTLNVEAIGNFKAAHRAQQLQKINEENLLLAALGTLLAALPELPKQDSDESMPSAKKTEPRILPAPQNKAAPLVPSLPPLPTVPAPAAVPVLRVGKAFQLLPVAQEQSFIQSRLDVKGRSLRVLEFQPLQYQIASAQASALQSYVEAEGPARWIVMASVPAQEDRLAREVFSRLSSVREKLIASGVRPEAIAVRTVLQDGANYSNGRRVFIDVQPGASVHSN
jgi:hypothetical protein